MKCKHCRFPGCYREIAEDSNYCEIHTELGWERDRIAKDARERIEKERLKQIWADLKRNKQQHGWYNTRAWRNVRAQVLAAQQCCMQCGSACFLEVHHINKAQTLEEFLDIDNLVVLCRECHKKVTAAQMRQGKK